MGDTIELLKKFTPEIMEILERRYRVLQLINENKVIGRRMLADKLSLGERIVRGEIDFLKDKGFITSSAAGVSLTPESEIMVIQLGDLVHQFRGLASLEIYLAERLSLQGVFIVPGNLDEEPGVFTELGKLAGRCIADRAEDNWVIAVGGGTTMAEVALHTPSSHGKKGIKVVPARGGLGEGVEIQANSIAAGVAHGLGASYRLLHMPDDINADEMEGLLRDRRIQEVVHLNKVANLLVHGIGIPQVMAQRRDLDWNQLSGSFKAQPVGEAFGTYFGADGSVVYAASTLGPNLEDLSRLKLVMAVAGGKSKAQAIRAVLLAGFIDVLIIDQGAAEVLQEYLCSKG